MAQIARITRIASLNFKGTVEGTAASGYLRMIRQGPQGLSGFTLPVTFNMGIESGCPVNIEDVRVQREAGFFYGMMADLETFNRNAERFAETLSSLGFIDKMLHISNSKRSNYGGNVIFYKIPRDRLFNLSGLCGQDIDQDQPMPFLSGQKRGDIADLINRSEEGIGERLLNLRIKTFPEASGESYKPLQVFPLELAERILEAGQYFSLITAIRWSEAIFPWSHLSQQGRHGRRIAAPDSSDYY